MTCLSMIRTDIARLAPSVAGAVVTPPGYYPTDLRSAYSLPAPASGAGSGITVAIVDAYDLASAATDLAAYRSQFGLSACTVANNCFRKVDQNGGTHYPGPDPQAQWGIETALDIEMVSAICPNCHILLVEADTPNTDDLGTAVNTAVRLGASTASTSTILAWRSRSAAATKASACNSRRHRPT
jgi:subtilase family serine protease